MTHRRKAHFHHHMMHLLSLILRMEVWITCFSQLEPLLPQNNGTWSVYVCNLMKNTEGTIDDQQMQAASLIKLFIMGAVYENFDSLCDTYGADSVNNYLNPMITVSDNDAANTLVNMLGYGDDYRRYGCREQFLSGARIYQYFHGHDSFFRTMTYGDNYTSVSDCGHFLKEIYQSNAGTTDTTLSHTDAMYSLLKMQESTK